MSEQANTKAVWVVYDGRAISGDTDDAAVLESFGYPDVKDDEEAQRAATNTWSGQEFALYRYDLNEQREAQNERLILANRVTPSDTQRRLRILADLKSTKCAACGNPKKTMQSHCRRCYYALPSDMRRALYQRFGSGYEEAYEQSLQFLSEKNPPTKPIEAGAVSS